MHTNKPLFFQRKIMCMSKSSGNDCCCQSPSTRANVMQWLNWKWIWCISFNFFFSNGFHLNCIWLALAACVQAKRQTIKQNGRQTCRGNEIWVFCCYAVAEREMRSVFVPKHIVSIDESVAITVILNSIHTIACLVLLLLPSSSSSRLPLVCCCCCCRSTTHTFYLLFAA